MKLKSVLIPLLLMKVSGCAHLESKENNRAEQIPLEHSQTLQTQVNSIAFIHGAHLKGDSWHSLDGYLSSTGLTRFIFDMTSAEEMSDPDLFTLNYAADKLCNEIRTLPMPVALVVHSQGGAIAHQALARCEGLDIGHIIYVSAVAPIDGNKPFTLLSKSDEEAYFSGVSYENGWMKIADRSAFINSFTYSPSASLTQWMMNNAVDEPAITGEGKVKLAKGQLDAIRKTYIFANQDQIISRTSQEKIAQSIGVQEVYSLNSGHLPMLSEPAKLAEIIRDTLQL